jgi:hypothetical protein
MTSSTLDPIVGRKSVPVTERDLEDIEKLRRPTTPYGRALREILNEDYQSPTEAALLHVLLRLGIKVVAERAREEGYRQLAEMTTEEERMEMQALRRLYGERQVTEE